MATEDATGRARRGRQFLRKWTLLLFGCVFAAGLYQSQYIFRGFITQTGSMIWENRAYSPVERSAIFHEDLAFSEYMMFLRETIPEDAKVILPPHDSYQTIANFGFAQYFLMPRELHNCGSSEIEACVLRMTGEDSYIIVAGKFPPADVASNVKRFLPFKDDLGVWAPK